MVGLCGEQHKFAPFVPKDVKMETEDGTVVVAAPAPAPPEEILGSVTTFCTAEDPENGHTLRTSARVKHKMRIQDSIRCNAPPVGSDRKEPNKANAPPTGAAPGPKTPGQQQKRMRVIWSNHDKNLFFEALNEYGKDFEAILNYLNSKKRRKESGPADGQQTFKIKDVRLLYYQINQTVSKYLNFSDEIRKEAQELYALINYGEMRKKVPFQNKKYLHKLKDLVCKGFTTVREKGKNIRIKTPSCRALRKLNQLEEWQEEIKLPPRVDVLLKPCTMAAWARVQSLAQNPCVRITVTIQKRVSALLQLFQQKWRTQHQRLVERVDEMKKAALSIPSKVPRQRLLNDVHFCSQIAVTAAEGGAGEPPSSGVLLLHFRPLQSAVIHRPMINLIEFQSNTSICLNSYEQRIGVKVRSETLAGDKLAKDCKDRPPANVKRQRCDSGSDKLAPPDAKKMKPGAPGDTKDAGPGTLLALELPLGEGFKSSNSCSSELMLELKDVDYLGDDAKQAGCSAPFFTLHSLPGKLELADQKRTQDLFNLHSDTSSDGFAAVEGDGKGHADNNGNSAGEDVAKPTVKRKLQPTKRKCSKATLPTINEFRPLVSEKEIRKIRDGWTMANAGDLTVGDLYIIFGEDMKLNLEYDWRLAGETREVVVEDDEGTADGEVGEVLSNHAAIASPHADSSMAAKEDATCSRMGAGTSSSSSSGSSSGISVSGRLKQLLLLVNLGDRTFKKKCLCGPGSDRKPKRVDVDGDSLPTPCDNCALFKQPMLPVRNTTSSLISNLHIPSQVRYKQKRWWRSRINHQHTPHQQLLPLQPLPLPSGPSGRPHPSSHSVISSTLKDIKNRALLVGGAKSVAPEASRAARHSIYVEENANDIVKPLTPGSTATDGSSSSFTGRRSSTDEDSCISLFDVSLPSTSSSLMANIFQTSTGESVDLSPTGSVSDILPDSEIEEKMLDTDLADISLTSVFERFDAAFRDQHDEDDEQFPRGTAQKDSDMAISELGESSIDYIARFEAIAAELRAQQNT
ncbi:protein cramped [Anopheles cruzii]|uniref:protein cramped n=1 Tax=Anopheles cruzii TaxID=68878 RepID=UPI0022EC45C8|nr:protein cramped [Anopheles cruzii]